MGSNYQKDMFRQLTELMEKADSLQQEQKEYHKLSAQNSAMKYF